MADVQVVSRMTEAAAVDVVKSRGSVQRWHADRRLGRSRRVVGIIVGQRTGSTHFFEACRLQERECVVTVPPIGLTTLESRVAFLLALVEVLETHKPLWHRAQQSHLLRRPAPRGLPERLGTGPTSSRTPLSVPRPPVPAGRTTTPERPPATTPSPATGIGIDIRRAGIARAVAENTTTIADQPTEEPVVSRRVRRARMTVRLFDKPRSRRC